MYRTYSSAVVAPMTWSSPRASAGFRRFAASMEESAPARPAPTSWWISSTKRQMPFSASVTSAMTFLRRSSNSPRYFVPATMAPRSREYRRLPCSRAGTVPSTIRCARPSATAVFPTPGGPTRQALFFLRRSRTWMTRCSSGSRPTTGSSIPSIAICVRSVATSSSASCGPSPSAPTAASCRAAPPWAAPGRRSSASMAVPSWAPSTPRLPSILAAPESAKAGLPSASRSCSFPTSPPFASALARSKRRFAFSLKGSEPEPLLGEGPRETASSATALATASRVTPLWARADFATCFRAPFGSSVTMPKRTSSVQTAP
mmetsp:Transcript_61466/g.183192  ORF Transcript_61466/g.183192 Transcript_61466/m.183192 type:complete len:317 (-) Transcript_61466:166-1116(-)